MKLPSYYAAQEPAYKNIREKGEAGWLRKTFDEFRDPETDAIIQKYVTSHFSDTSGLSALDLGTGTGSTAHALYDLGFKVTGIDVCPSAIKSAIEIALKEKKDIHFEVADVLALNTSYDLIYDSHCVHCVVFEADRESLFKSIHEALRPNGVFILDSMIFDEADVSWKTIESLRIDEDYILWHKTKGETHTGVVKIGDTFWCPQRRIYPLDKILNELQSHRFNVIDYSIDQYMIRALCTPC